MHYLPLVSILSLVGGGVSFSFYKLASMGVVPFIIGVCVSGAFTVNKLLSSEEEN